MQRQPMIEDMVALLEKVSPNQIQKIRTENPQYSKILKIGSVLGDGGSDEELKVRAKVCFTAIEVVIVKCNEEVPILKKKLRNSQKTQLWGQIITTVSGASVITTLATNHKTITYIGGFLSLFGALVPLIVNFQKQGFDKSKLLDDNYLSLVKMKIEAEMNANELKFYVDNNFNTAGISEVINKSNKLCSDISELLLVL